VGGEGVGHIEKKKGEKRIKIGFLKKSILDEERRDKRKLGERSRRITRGSDLSEVMLPGPWEGAALKTILASSFYFA
jgi:hypothetical protein